jgi:hypothetical protein
MWNVEDKNDFTVARRISKSSMSVSAQILRQGETSTGNHTSLENATTREI